MIVAELRVTTVGEGTSLHEPVKEALEALQERGLRYEVGPLGTVIEGETLQEVLGAVQACHERVRQHAGRILTEVAIDERLDKQETAQNLKQV